MAKLLLESGNTLSYQELGTGQPILCLHGWGMRGAIFAPQRQGLGEAFRVICPDLAGHGESSPLPSDAGLPQLSSDIAQLLTQLDLDNVLIVGWSMGAMVAWGTLMGAAANRVAGLVVIDMVPKLLSDDDWPWGLRRGTDSSVFAAAVQRMGADWPAFTRIFIPRVIARGYQDERHALINDLAEASIANDADSMARLWLSMAGMDFRESLRTLSTPTLVTYGELSQLYKPAAARWLVAQMPNATAMGFAHSGHAPHLEEPDLFNDTVAAYARQCASH